MTEFSTDPWETGPEFPSPIIGDELENDPEPSKPARRGKLRYISALGVAMVVGLAAAPAEKTPTLNSKFGIAQRARRDALQREAYIGKYIKMAATGDYTDCEHPVALPPQIFSPQDARLSALEIEKDIDEYRAALHERPLIPDSLLDRNAGITAELLAADPSLINHFNSMPAVNPDIDIDGLAESKWDKVRQIPVESSNGQTTLAASCYIDTAPYAQIIREASYIGIATLHVDDHIREDRNMRVWLADFGLRVH